MNTGQVNIEICNFDLYGEEKTHVSVEYFDGINKYNSNINMVSFCGEENPLVYSYPASTIKKNRQYISITTYTMYTSVYIKGFGEATHSMSLCSPITIDTYYYGDSNVPE